MSTLVVLGAGASRAARPTSTVEVECLPPLNADFFTQLQRITVSKHRTAIERVIGDIVELFGSNFSLTLEDYFTQLEFMIQAVAIAGRHPDFQRTDLSRKRENLMAALSAVLEASTDSVIRAGGCRFHDRLVDRLRPGDTILSLNYDCLIDDALRRIGNRKWNAKWGYGFPLKDYLLSGAENWNPKRPATSRRKSIMLLKLHGSIGWQLPEGTGQTIRLKQRLHQQRGIPRFTIIPPGWNKGIDTNAVFSSIWRQAAVRIRRARTIAVIGFSFVATDLHAESVFRIALGEKTALQRLIIANPSGTVRRRIRSIFDVPLMRQGVLVRQYDDFESFLDALPGALN